jgi:DNA mismatch repair protein MSH2
LVEFFCDLSELTSSLATVAAVRNLSVAALAEGDTITFLYNVKPGACGQSFGVAVAELARFPSSVVDAAKRKLADLEGQYGDVDPHKRKKGVSTDDERTGKYLVKGFVEAIRQLPLDSEEDRKASLARARELHCSILADDNAYISSLLRAL